MRIALVVLLALSATAHAGPLAKPGRFSLPPAPGRHVDVDGMRIHYETEGSRDKTPLLLVHGILSSTHVWNKVRAHLAKDHYLVMVDLPNHGYSARTADADMSIAGQAKLLPKIMDALQLDKATVVGHSMGGAIAAYLAAIHPERVDKLVLVDSATYRFRMPIKAKLATLPVIGRFLLKHLYNRKLLSDYMRKDVYHDPSALPQSDLDTMYAHFDSPIAREAVYRAGVATADTRELERLIPEIQAPTLVVWGQQDKLIPVSLAARLGRDLSDVRVKVVEGSGHEVMNEQPAAFVDALRSFTTP